MFALTLLWKGDVITVSSDISDKNYILFVGKYGLLS